ncbi:DNA cytosine methyltransferase [Macromonas nakdongensis]|uniref:DNA cytosine methyltransferase n=1 Tax=Macromonas nakdongensis TaxID=1843082 RepID=UPI001E489B3A|nr:DNA cytosine methyltransferase [Macromonas nakdongensis]
MEDFEKNDLDLMATSGAIPVIDLFAGPGGLCEGFSSLCDAEGRRRFDVRVSIEKDPIAHKTLMLRALFRKFPKGEVPDSYYDYVRGDLSREAFLKLPEIKVAAEHAASEARCAELGVTPHEEIDAWIGEALRGSKDWVLIGGPPCQAYSLAGRSRLRGKNPEAFEADKRHFLYTEYLRIIQVFKPSVFVMENVKGMLTSQHGGSPIFDRILADLQNPLEGLRYQVRSFVVHGDDLKPNDYVIKAENYGIPQCRHRVILFGVRSDLADAADKLVLHPNKFLLTPSSETVGVKDALHGLPALRSQLSREIDSPQAWLKALKEAPASLTSWRDPVRPAVERQMEIALMLAGTLLSAGGKYMKASETKPPKELPKELRTWCWDARLKGVIQHQTRKHMKADLHRYLFAACYALDQGISPKLNNFPPKLLPDHGNVDDEDVPFKDRFRVQIGGNPSTTVVAHIKKDGHYYIHPDPYQCRSLTVREAARLQTFPDNYYFEGNRTEQYGQIGNAVPPLLARKIANIVHKFLSSVRGIPR